MSKVEIPEGYKELSFNQPHIETLGPGYYKREDNNLYMAFYVKTGELQRLWNCSRRNVDGFSRFCHGFIRNEKQEQSNNNCKFFIRNL